MGNNTVGSTTRGSRVDGNAIERAFRENQEKMREQSGQTFGPQNEIQRRVAEQRSENELNIKESAGEISKKQSTVQASSDILKGEQENAQGKFASGYETEKGKQNFIPTNPSVEDVKARLAELRKKAG